MQICSHLALTPCAPLNFRAAESSGGFELRHTSTIRLSKLYEHIRHTSTIRLSKLELHEHMTLLP